MPLVILDQLAGKVIKADLLRLFDEVGGLAGSRVGKIELSGGRATVEVPSGWEERLADCWMVPCCIAAESPPGPARTAIRPVPITNICNASFA